MTATIAFFIIVAALVVGIACKMVADARNPPSLDSDWYQGPWL
jgi:hypothetical protein